MHNKHIALPTEFSPIGETYILADFYGCQVKDLDDVEYIQQSMRGAALKANATIAQEKALGE